MHRGYRCIIIAALGWLIAGALSAQQDNSRGNTAQNNASEHEGNAAVSARRPAPHPTEHKKAENGCIGTDKPALSCDAISAQAAIDQADAARSQVIFGAISAIVGALTLAAAGFAAWYAKSASDAASKALRLEYRPWLIVIPEAKGMATFSERGFSISFIVTIKNVGNGVARNIFNGMGRENICGTEPGWVEDLYDRWLKVASDAIDSGALLQPGDQTTYQTELVFPPDLIARGGFIEAGTRSFLPTFVFAVSYRSILGDQWHQTGKALTLIASHLTEYGAYISEDFDFQESLVAGRAI